MTTFLSRASLSTDERRRAERAFTESRDCVIVATSTLELGIDVGDLDRVIQVDAPARVASFLQRLGRSGRRAGGTRNCLFLATGEPGLLQAAGLLLLWSRSWVEPVEPPPEPRHIVAQQVLALCLQEHRVGRNVLGEWWAGLPMFGALTPVVNHLVEDGYLDVEDGMLFVGPEAERRFGNRHFMGLTSAFTAPPEFTVLHGRTEIGRTDPVLLAGRVDGPRRLLLAGQSWQVTWTDWKRRRCFVEPVDAGGRARWITPGTVETSFAAARAVREVLLGSDPPVRLTRRAMSALAKARETALATVHPAGTVIVRAPDEDVRWWTWAGYRANATLKATLTDLADPSQRVEDFFVRLRTGTTPQSFRSALDAARDRLCLPDPDDRALTGLKFAEALPDRLARATLASRLADLPGAALTLAEPHRFTIS